MAGYAVECGLKARIAWLFESEAFPEKTFSEKCYVHDIEKLVVLGELKPLRDAAAAANANLDANWAIVRVWTEASRYQQKTQAEAQALFDAITQNPDGVLRWIQLHW